MVLPLGREESGSQVAKQAGKLSAKTKHINNKSRKVVHKQWTLSCSYKTDTCLVSNTLILYIIINNNLYETKISLVDK